ncbi:binding-protein-dependent transport systems inner membrane component [Syntrophobotulus glycolicus DSM 8271]|uniref:Binding-protein-dependent transport systems inner membrane component n=1 Tax=Syntrophobotulus glycolicus (strain DSM 8271 / FlGlyR) TaxID=645991 RepID=F0T2M3_SYNGF|nr:ABC transporter permease [Syntrophobotulus glycolicus]ADY56422.1 binding-protein-dependent transport systems inner membrane component [Syntrophobotulus glycolicus DSM 8271]
MKRIKILQIGGPILVLALCCFGYLFAPNDPYFADMANRLVRPCSAYPLGTDILGRCTLSRLLYGGRTTIGIVALGCLCVAILGMVTGLLISRPKDKQGVLFESILNAVTAIPPIAYLIIFIAAWGNGILTMLVAITLSLFLRLIKLVKTRAEIEMGRAYVMCAVTSGAGRLRVLFWQILPNLVSDVIRFICLSCADMVLAIVGFSFIGLGLGDHVIDWGSMVSDSNQMMLSYPGLTLYPVVFIFLSTLSFHLLGRAASKEGGYYA